MIQHDGNALKSLYNFLPDAIFQMDTEGRFLSANPASTTISGYSEKELKEMGSFRDIILPSELATTEGYFLKTLANTSHQFETTILNKSGKHVHLQVYTVPNLEGGKIVGVLGIAKDISERKKNDEELKLNTRILLNLAEGVYLVRTSDGIIVYANSKFEAMFGYDKGELIGKHVSTVNAPSKLTPEEVAREIMECLYKKGEWHGEIQNIRKDGTPFWCHASVSEFEHSEYGKVWISVHIDITDRKKAEEKQSRFFELSRDWLCIVDTDGYFKEVNQALVNALGYTKEELLSKPLVGFIHPDDRKSTLDEVRDQFHGKVTTSFENRYICKDGSIKHLAWSASPLYDEGLVYAIGHDITERKKTEDALRESEQRYRSIVNASPLCIHEIDMQGHITSMNQAGLCMMGLRNECEIQGFPYLEAVCDADRDRIGQLLANAYAGETNHFEFKASGPTTLFFKSCFVPIKDKAGNVIKLMGITEDITERKRLEQQKEQYSRFFQLSTDLMCIADPFGCFKQVNPAFERMTGFSEIELISKPFMEFILPEDRQRTLDEMKQQVEVRPSMNFENRYVCKDGTLKFLSWTAYYDKNDNVTYATARDITKRKLAEEALKRLNQDFVLFLENTTDFIYFKDENSRFRFCSQTLANITGHKSWRDMIGKHDLEVFPKDTAQIYYEEELPVFRDGKPLLNKIDPYYDAQGKECWVSTNKWPVFDDEGRKVVGLFGISRDVTEQKHIEIELKKSKSQYDRLATNIPIGVYLLHTTASGKFTFRYVSSRFSSMLGIPAESIYADSSLAFKVVHPDDMQNFVELNKKAVEFRESFFWEGRMIINGVTRWMQIQSKPEPLGNGDCIWDGVLIDITERKEAEEKLKLSLREKEILLLEIHHRVKNNLQVISGLLRMQLDSITKSKITLDTVRNAFLDCQTRVDTMSMIHERLYQSKNLAEIDFSAYLKDLTNDLILLFGKDETISPEFKGDTILLGIDKAIPLALIVNELISNVLKYAFPDDREGKLTITFQEASGDSIFLSISDNGIGIPDTYDFQSPDSLGLRLVKGLVSQINGKVSLDASNGTTVTITFKKDIR